MISKPDDLPSDLVSALAALQAEREARLRAEAMAASALAELSDNAAIIAHLELRIEKFKRELHGQRSERSARLLEQLEMELEELVTSASEDELAAQAAAAKTQNVRPFMRKRPVRKPWPDDIEHERVVVEAPKTCTCCGGSRLAKVGEDVTKTLEEIPRRFKVIETVREKFTCRDCEKISQSPAPFHATPRGFIGPQLLATILFDKFGMHIPLNRQSVRFKAERIDLPLSTLADQIGHGTFAVMPLFHLIERHVLAAERLHGDDTTIRILARASARPAGSGLMCGMTGRSPGPRRRQRSITPRATDEASILRSIWRSLPASCKPIATTASSRCSPRTRRHCPLHRRIALPMPGEASSSWPTSRKMLGKTRRESRSPRSHWRRSGGWTRCSRSIVPSTAVTLRTGAPSARNRANRFSKTCTPGCCASAEPSRALRRWEGFARFLDDGRICLTNNCAERALRGIALGRRNWTFAGSLRGADRAAIMLTMITTCRLNDVDPKAWLADVLARIAELPTSRLHELLPWEWKLLRQAGNSDDQQAA